MYIDEEKSKDYMEILTELYSSGEVCNYIARNFPKLRKDDIIELVSDTFCELIERSEKENHKEEKLVRGLAYKRAFQKAVDLTRNRIFNSTDYFGDDFNEITDLCVSVVTNSVEDEIVSKECAKEVRGLVNALPKEHQIIILLRYGNCKSYKEIAEKLDMNENSLRNLEHRIRKRLLTLAKERGVTLR